MDVYICLWLSKEEIDNELFVVDIYEEDGQTIKELERIIEKIQVTSDSIQAGVNESQGAHTIRVTMDELHTFNDPVKI